MHQTPLGSTEPANALRRAFRTAWSASPWLTMTGLLMVVDTVLSLIGLAIDPTIITGAPAWLKPLKFGISTSLFCLTVAFMIGQLQRTRRFASIVGWFLAAALTIEIVLIDMQAARHTTSHFNFTTPFDALVFAAMGMGIIVVFLSTTLLLIAACLEKFPDRTLGWAMRFSLLLALLGMGVGPLMTMPTPEQLAAQQATHGRMPHIGAHTVGGPDGGPGMPITGWSANHGDLRIAHFVGLHAMQLLLTGWFLTRRWQPRRQTRLIFGLTALTVLAFAALLVQALHGLPLLRPDAITQEAWAICAAAAFATWLLTRTTSPETAQ